MGGGYSEGPGAPEGSARGRLRRTTRFGAPFFLEFQISAPNSVFFVSCFLLM